MKHSFKIKRAIIKGSIITVGVFLSLLMNFRDSDFPNLDLKNLSKIALASDESGVPCPYGYKSTTTWPGNCINCYCETWNYTGRDSCPRR